MNAKPIGCLLIGLALAAAPVAGASPESWSASTIESFAAGTLDGTAVDEQGRVSLAPTTENLWGPEDGIVWSVLPSRGDGALIALSGPGRILQVSPGREPEIWFELEEEGLVSAMTPDGFGGVFFAVSPDGDIYHARSASDVERVAETAAKFVWALALDAEGALWIGTGVPGSVMRLAPDGDLETRFDAEDDLVRCLDVAPGGGVVFGTGGRGRVIRIGAGGEPFVLLDVESPEVVDLEVAEDGTVFVLAGSGAKQVKGSASAADDRATAGTATVRVVARPPSDGEGKDAPDDAGPSPKAAPKRTSPSTFKTTAGGRLLRIDPDGSVRRLWSTRTEMPFALLLHEDGRLLVATGDGGKLYLVDGEGRPSQLARIASNQASALAAAGDGSVLVGGTSDARVDRIVLAAVAGEGTYLTEAVDAGVPSDWGRVHWEATVPRGARLRASVRAGNTAEPDVTWTEWAPLRGESGDSGALTDLPRARWAQVRFELTGRRDARPTLSQVRIFYEPQNRGPEILQLGLESPGIVWAEGPRPSASRLGPQVATDPVALAAMDRIQPARRAPGPIRKSYEAGARTFTWATTDPDNDELLQELQIQREGAIDWMILGRDIDGKFFSWDARGVPDGWYRARLVVDDSPSNPNGRERTTSRTSERFHVDNQRPSVKSLSVESRDGFLEATFVATDPGGRVASAEISVDGNEWAPLTPVDGVADSNEESYRLRLPSAERGPETVPSVRVRITDAAGNLGGDWFRIED